MSELKQAILAARYADMIGLADYVVRDCGLPDMDEDGNLLPQANEVAAALFRWAAGADAQTGSQRVTERPDAGTAALTAVSGTELDEYDENGDPQIDVETAEQREAERMAQAEETS